MEGDIIFNKEHQKDRSETNSRVPFQKKTFITPSQAAISGRDVTNDPLPPPPKSGFKGLILKILIGVTAAIFFGFVLIQFIIPMFTGANKQKVTLTYWGLWESEKTMATIINKFQSTHPNISIKYIRQDIKQYNETLQTRINNGTGPDIFRYHNTWIPMLKEELLPLSQDAIKPDDFKKKYYPVMHSNLIRNGAIYGIPIGFDTLAMFENTEITREAGVTTPSDWNEFVKSAIKITVKDGSGKIKTSGAALGTYDNITHAPDILGMLFAQNGTDTTNMLKTKSNASETLQFYTSFATGNGRMWDETMDNSIEAFAKGQVGFYFGYSWDIFQIKSINPDIKFTVNKVPGLPGRRMTVASYWVEGVSAKTKHSKEAMEFMNFLSLESTTEQLFAETAKTREFGELYPMVTQREKLKSNSMLFPFVDQGDTAVSTYFASNTFDNGINDRMNAYLGNAVRSVSGNTSADTAIETLNGGILQVLSLYERTPTSTR